MGRGRAFVAEPESNNGDVNARLQQVHGGSVAKDMWRNTFTAEACTAARGSLHGPSQTVGNCRARKRAAR